MINHYVVGWSTANESKVATQLMRQEITSFEIQNQASYFVSALDGGLRFKTDYAATAVETSSNQNTARHCAQKRC
jgi:hypothetical protein